MKVPASVKLPKAYRMPVALRLKNNKGRTMKLALPELPKNFIYEGDNSEDFVPKRNSLPNE